MVLAALVHRGRQAPLVTLVELVPLACGVMTETQEPPEVLVRPVAPAPLEPTV